MDLPLSLPDSPVAWWVDFIHSWAPLGFCLFPRLPWVTAGFLSLQQPSALPWTCWDLKYGVPQHPCSAVSSNNSNVLLWDIIQWEHFDSGKKLESSLFQLIQFITSHWLVNFCFKLLKLFYVGLQWFGVKCAILISEWVFNFHRSHDVSKDDPFRFHQTWFSLSCLYLDERNLLLILALYFTLDRLITFCWFYISGIYCLLNIIGEIWVSIKALEKI